MHTHVNCIIVYDFLYIYKITKDVLLQFTFESKDFTCSRKIEFLGLSHEPITRPAQRQLRGPESLESVSFEFGAQLYLVALWPTFGGLPTPVP